MSQESTDREEWIRAAMTRFERPLLQYASRITGDVELARDVVQDAFLRLCRQLPSKVDGHLAEWLFTVCRRRAIDVRRKDSRLRPFHDAELEAEASREPSPDESADRTERMDDILTALGELPPNQREVVRLKFQHGFRYQEISKVTGLSVSNVGFLLHTALKTLRQRLRTRETGDPTRGKSYEHRS